MHEGCFCFAALDLQAEQKAGHTKRHTEKGHMWQRAHHYFNWLCAIPVTIVFPFPCADEIDAIGKARGRSGGGDTGTREREQGLMQMLYEMDGFASNNGVLVVGATNRVSLLDDALLRKGRFDMIIYMGRPSTSNRFKILQVHLASVSPLQQLVYLMQSCQFSCGAKDNFLGSVDSVLGMHCSMYHIAEHAEADGLVHTEDRGSQAGLLLVGGN